MNNHVETRETASNSFHLINDDSRIKRGFGDFFQEVTGKSIVECETIEEINKAIEESTKRKPLRKSSSCGLVSKSGDIFSHIKMPSGRALDAMVDRALKL